MSRYDEGEGWLTPSRALNERHVIYLLFVNDLLQRHSMAGYRSTMVMLYGSNKRVGGEGSSGEIGDGEL